METDEKQNHRYLLEKEVAELLRCSKSRVKQLRLSGKLPYIEGRPVLVDRKDLRQFIDDLKIVAASPPIATAWKDPDAWEKGAEKARKVWMKMQQKHP